MRKRVRLIADKNNRNAKVAELEKIAAIKAKTKGKIKRKPRRGCGCRGKRK